MIVLSICPVLLASTELTTLTVDLRPWYYHSKSKTSMTRVRPSQLADGDSILASRPFEFFIGTNERLFTMHSALVAHHSQPLHALVHGKMLESNQGKAHLADVDEHTFVRFSEFAYSGDYTPAEPEILLKTSDIDHAPVQLNNALSEEPSREPLPVPEPEQPPDFEVVPPAEPPAPAWDEWGVAPKVDSTVSFRWTR